jgi:hypothetical protein
MTISLLLLVAIDIKHDGTLNAIDILLFLGYNSYNK